MATLVIENVDFEELERHRLILIQVHHDLPDGPEREAVLGIQNMLDDWSDKIYFEENENGK